MNFPQILPARVAALLAVLAMASLTPLASGAPLDPSDYGQSNLSGLVLQISPGAYMIIQVHDGSPTVFMDPHVCYVNQQGQKIESREIAVGKRVTLSYVRQGPDILVTQVMLADR